MEDAINKEYLLNRKCNDILYFKTSFMPLTVGPFLRVQLQHTHFELEVSGDHLVQVDHKTMR